MATHIDNVFIHQPIMVNGERVSDEIQSKVLEEAQRWAKHCGHFVIDEGLERYILMVKKTFDQ